MLRCEHITGPDRFLALKSSPVLNTVDLTDQQRTLVPVSTTTSLFTYAPRRVGSATISVTSAEVLVDLLPLSP